jgi:hypothetical protein
MGRKLRIISANANIFLISCRLPSLWAVFSLIFQSLSKPSERCAFPVFRVLPSAQTGTIDWAPKKTTGKEDKKWQTN